MTNLLADRMATRLACGVLLLFANAACLKVGPQPTQIGDHLHFAGDSVQLNTRSDGQHAFVSGYVGKNGPLNLIVDTGAGVNVIDRSLAERLSLKKVGVKEVLSGGVEPVTADIVVIPLVRVGNLRIENAKFITLDLDGMSLGQLQGVLGMELFREATITFDPGNERITVSQTPLSAGKPGVMAYDRDAESGFRIDISVAGQPVLMNLDTGAPSGFTFPLAFSDMLPLQGGLQAGPTAQLVGGQRSIRRGTLNGMIELGEFQYQNPPVAFINPSTPHGNIGNAILRDVVLSIDQQNGLLAFRKTRTAPITRTVASTDAGKPRRLGIQLRSLPAGSPPTVTMVEPGSLGEQAGIKTGDVLVMLNGRPMEEFSLRKLGPLFRSATPLHFEVDRDGQPHIVEIN